MLLIILFLLSVMTIASGIIWKVKGKSYGSDGYFATITVGCIAVFAITLWTIATISSGICDYANMKSFYDNNATVSKQAIQEATSTAIITGHIPKDQLGILNTILPKENLPELANLDNMQQSKEITHLIRQYRDAVLEYNANLQYYRKVQFIYYPLIPSFDDLKPINY